MGKKLIVFFFAIIIIVAISFCLVSSDSSEESKLGEKPWILSQYLLDNELEPVNQETSLICAFTDDNTLSGILGCNYYFGSFKLNGNKIDISNFKSSNLISNEKIMALENRYEELLLNAAYYSVDNNSLILFDQNYCEILIFKNESLSIKEKNWHLYYSDPEFSFLFLNDSTSLIFLENNSIVGSIGSIKYSGRYHLNDDNIQLNSVSTYNESDILIETNNETQLYFSLLEKIDSYFIMINQIDFFDKYGIVILSYSDLPNELFFNDWYPVSYTINNNQENPIPDDSYPIMCFSPDGKVTGNLFNTSFIATYYADGENMKIDQIAISRTTSEGNLEKSDDELNLFSLLEKTSSYSIFENCLKIYDNNQTDILKCFNEPPIF